MKVVLVLALALMISCSAMDGELQSAISYGEIVELNQYSKDVDKQLMVRLFKSPLYKEGCFKETHGVCQYQYFLSVSTFDENPETNIYRLSEIGEIVEIKWLASEGVDTAVIELELEKYTKMALSNNPELASERFLLKVTLTPGSIDQTLITLSE